MSASSEPAVDRQVAMVARLLGDLPGEPSTQAATADLVVLAAPPASLRSRLLERVRASAADAPLPARAQLPRPARAYADQVAALDVLLTGFSSAQWALVVVNGWSADRLLGHLLAVDALAAAAIGLPTPPQTGVGDTPRARTANVHARLDGAGPVAWQRVWRAQAVALLRHAVAVGEAALAGPVRYLGVRLTAADVLLDRGFETWMHGEDLREASGHPPTATAPGPDDVELLADLAVRMLPRAWAGSGAPARTGRLDVELTGAGGGVWTIDPDSTVRAVRIPAPRAPATLRLDAMEFCRLAGGRLAAVDVVHASEGEPGLVSAALAAAAALARI